MTDRFAIPSGTPYTVGGCPTALGPYCGGTWSGLMENLDYIQGMNFDAIWMSPIIAQLPQLTPDGRSYAGYWQQDLMDINYNFGSSEDLHALIDEIHARGMYYMMDVSVNHMAFSGAADAIDYSVLNPFDNEKYYHPYCELDYSGKNITSLEQCWLGSWFVPLADLRTESKEVREIFGTWIKEMVANYSVDGLRIDTGVNVEPSFFTDFVESAGVFATAEVYLSNDSVACEWEATVGSIINYPLYWPLTAAFTPYGSYDNLTAMMVSEQSSCKDTTVLATFSENQDVPRFANHTSDLSLAKNVATFVILSDGIPIIYQGQEQHLGGGTDPFTNREALWETGLSVFATMYQHIATLNTFRRHVIQISSNYTATQTNVTHQDDNFMVMRKGVDGAQVITVLNNGGESQTSDDLALSSSEHGYTSGTVVTELLTCTNLTVSSTGALTVPMVGGLPSILFPAASLSNSSLCDMGGKKFGYEDIPGTVTASTYTTTISGTPTAAVVLATLPVLSSTTSAATSTSTATTKSMASQPAANSRWVAFAAAIALALSSGLVGLLIGSVA
ncbi:hypothetical protein LTR36_007191 [Oleoguttula mirabilis]|uniref:alpha-amylase n=1 Tax=Oleoguttula mirabilis TaxID=1507867 RepID=A0AAV9JB12_9PEZI|nr:hypothetical protein LTR36_007191 [Oleoguttula mirabilis]